MINRSNKQATNINKQTLKINTRILTFKWHNYHGCYHTVNRQISRVYTRQLIR